MSPHTDQLPNAPRGFLSSTGHRLGVIVLACALWLCPTLSHAADSKPTPNTGLDWLHLIDHQQFEQSWDKASVFLKQHITKAQWNDILRRQRLPLGTISSRNHMTSTFEYNIPGIGDGTFHVTVYRTSFANQKTMDETLILAREADGQWRAIGYYLK